MWLLTRRAALFIVLLPRPWQLKEGKEAQRMPVQVTVRVQLRLLRDRGVAWGEGETQMVAHLDEKKELVDSDKAKCGMV